MGATVPDSPHATVVCLPTLADVESYERKEERVWKLLRAGYPRFVRNALVTRAAQEAARRLGRPGELFPLVSEASARRLAEHAGATLTSVDRVGDWCLATTPAGDAALRLAKMVQHTGTLISSRQAEAWLAGASPADGAAALATIRAALSPLLAGVAVSDILVATSGMNAVDAGIAAVDVAIVLLWGPKALVYLVLATVFALGLHPVGGRWIQEHVVTAPDQETYSYYGPLNRVA
ncbi:MAG: hypothetical protein EBR83_00980, partial [Verrucomicrobia bacterium]|nr:hypothetical protein [Verrucomicrobiota bacterium]